ncbi:MAG: ATP-dependent Clp protease adaptor ClpS [Armatimonadetes bacterium]|nr:ATP-dependent Clp protease adaptor ClpS [Armatimonadota bacterium]
MERLIPACASPDTIERPELFDTPEINQDSGWIVTVFDNDFNTVEEVITILLVATKCTLDEAQIETWEVHHLGKSVVHHGAEEECRGVAKVIGTIGIRVEVSKED